MCFIKIIIESNKKYHLKKYGGVIFFLTFPGLQTVKSEQLSSGTKSFYQQQSN